MTDSPFAAARSLIPPMPTNEPYDVFESDQVTYLGKVYATNYEEATTKAAEKFGRPKTSLFLVRRLPC